MGVMSLRVNLYDVDENKMYSQWLPFGTPNGRFSFFENATSDIFVEAIDDCWCINCRDGEIVGMLKGTSKAVLKDNSYFRILTSEKRYIAWTEKYSEYSRLYVKYQIINTDELTIGRDSDNDIQIMDNRISGYHAMLKWADGSWYIKDCDSTNGTFVNGETISVRKLQCGDAVYFMGINLLIGVGFIAFQSDRDELLKLNHNKLIRIDRCVKSDKCDVDMTESEETLFYRHPRTRKPLLIEPIDIELPPMSMSSERLPLVLRMGSTMMHGATGLLTGNVMSSVSTLLFPLLTNGYTEKDRRNYEERRSSFYRKYLLDKSNAIQEEINKEEEILRFNYPDTATLLSDTSKETKLWERKISDDDFLHIRVGSGKMKLLAPISYPKERMNIDEDELENEMRKVVSVPYYIKNVPVQISLIDDFICGVEGDFECKIAFITNFLMQLTLLHSYDEVKVVFLSDMQTLEKIDFIRYLPHLWNDDRNFRFIASDPSESFRISEYLKNQFEKESGCEGNLKSILKQRPYYVVVATDKKCFDSMEFLKDTLQSDTSLGLSIITLFDSVPKECSLIFRLKENNQNEIVYLKEIDREAQNFRLDKVEEKDVKKTARIMANTKLRNASQAYTLPKTLTFLEMFSAGKIEHLNIENRWKSNNPIQSLSTPVGVATDGSVFYLDLHQKYQGPHGLVAGTTGSGKSEFLLTYILSLAVNFHPDEVAFLLIDYKGGGLAGAFDDPKKEIHLPHLVGTITNLDGSAIQRSLVSINSEITRRQKVFNDIKSQTGEGTMDIYLYQRLYRNGSVKEPMPHLFIISDEFAELKAQEPEFMDELMSASRIGRSLGIHLILATQKPAGVVNEQIRSNTKFRVCLKVQDKNDSNDMLMRPDAADLKDTGRFYLQVGYNEFFALGQSAWSGADYCEQDEVIVQRDESVQIIDGTGHALADVKKKVEKKNKSGTQLVAIVKAISDVARENGIVAKQLWKPALESKISYTSLVDKYPRKNEQELYSRIGLVDDPENQVQFPLDFDLLTSGHTWLLGASGSGKTTLLRTILYDITMNYTPKEINYYIIDCSSHALNVFKDAPHCGAWVNEDNSLDIDRLFELVDAQVKERKKLFEQEEVSTYDLYIKKKALPLLLYIIDSFAGLTATKGGDKYYEQMSGYLKKCNGLGIKFIISTSQSNELYTKSKQELTNVIALNLKDKFEYGDILGCKCEYMPPKIKGRGMTRKEDRLLEYQSLYVTSGIPEDDNEWIKKQIKEKASKEGMDYLQRLLLPDLSISYDAFCASFKKGRFPLGYSLDTMIPVALPFKQLGQLSLYLGSSSGGLEIYNNFLKVANSNGMRILVIKRKTKSVFDNNSDYKVIECNKDNLFIFLQEISNDAAAKIAHLQEYTRAHGLKASSEDVYLETYEYMSTTQEQVLVLIESMSDLCDELVSSGQDPAMAQIINISRRLGIYFIAGFYPGESVNVSSETYKKFGVDKNRLFFGGRFDKQEIDSIPREYEAITDEIQYNRGFMRYRDKFYPLIMPCGEVILNEIAEDDQYIFKKGK